MNCSHGRHAPAGNRAPKLSYSQGQHCFGSKASHSPSFSAEAWNKRPPVPKAYRYLASGIDRYGSTLLPPGFLAKTSGCPRPFFTNKTPGSKKELPACRLTRHIDRLAMVHFGCSPKTTPGQVITNATMLSPDVALP